MQGSLQRVLKRDGLNFCYCFSAIGHIRLYSSLDTQPCLVQFFSVGIFLNIFYILIGLLALSASGSMVYARLFFKFFGVIFAAIAIWGFAMNGELRLVHTSISDSFFYLLAAIIALYLGFTSKLPRSYDH